MFRLTPTTFMFLDLTKLNDWKLADAAIVGGAATTLVNNMII
jgi:hypothetical protein